MQRKICKYFNLKIYLSFSLVNLDYYFLLASYLERARTQSIDSILVKKEKNDR
jgi:hypothetical protein